MSKKIKDNRTNKKIVPSLAMMPDGAKNLLVDIVDKDGYVIGNLETGTDHFTQAIWNANGIHWRLEYHPSQNTATIRGWALR